MLVTFGPKLTPKVYSFRASVPENNKKPLSGNQQKIQKALGQMHSTAKAVLPEKGTQFTHIRKEVHLETISRPNLKQIDTILLTIQPSTRDTTPDDRILKIQYSIKNDDDVSYSIMSKVTKGDTAHMLTQLQSPELLEEISTHLYKFNQELNPPN